MNPDHEECYLLSPVDDEQIGAAKLLVEKVIHSGAARPAEIVSAAKLLHALTCLPRVTEGLDVYLSVIGPRRTFREIETYHWWNVRLEDVYWQLDCGGHFYRPSSGGDTFTTMTWEASPGERPEFSDYSHLHRIVPDLQTYANGIAGIDFSTGEYRIEIQDADNQLLDDLADEESKEEEDEGESDEGTEPESEPGEHTDGERVRVTVSAVDSVEAELAEQIDYDEVDAREPDYSNASGSCDFCRQSLESLGLLIDGRIRGEISWANMCVRCFNARGEGLGWGKGQLFARQPGGKWRLVAGFRPL